jgi:outer membrane biosynthesis protein TonB
VDYAELISEGTGPNRSLASQAVYAARRWEFEPAREGERKVPGQVILHYRFGHTQMASQK